MTKSELKTGMIVQMRNGRMYLFVDDVFITKNGYGDMVLMSMELFEATQKKWSMYSDIELSEHQIKEGKTKDARKALSAVRDKYGL